MSRWYLGKCIPLLLFYICNSSFSIQGASRSEMFMPQPLALSSFFCNDSSVVSPSDFILVAVFLSRLFLSIGLWPLWPAFLPSVASFSQSWQFCQGTADQNTVMWDWDLFRPVYQSSFRSRCFHPSGQRPHQMALGYYLKATAFSKS